MATEAASATPCQRSTPAVSDSSLPANDALGMAVSGFTGAGALMNGYYGWRLWIGKLREGDAALLTWRVEV